MKLAVAQDRCTVLEKDLKDAKSESQAKIDKLKDELKVKD